MGKEKSKKEKNKSKSKKEKKDKKHKKHRRQSSSDSSDSDGSVEGADEQLSRERAAVNKLRDILSAFPAVRKELREMLWHVDQGKAANISGVPDPDLKSNLAELLGLLRLRCTDKGIFGLINRSEKILPVVSFVFDEPPRPRPQPWPAQTLGPTAAAAPAARAPQSITAPASAASEPEAAGFTAGKPDLDAEPARCCAFPIGPIGPPGAGPPADEGDDAGAARGLDAAPEAARGEAAGQRDDGRDAGTVSAEGPAAPRRVAGPAMPPRELLEAAAAAVEALRSAGPPGAAGLPYGDEDDDGGDLVGPPPPELVEELEAAPHDAREAEVIRIVKVLREHNTAAGAAGPKSQLAPSGPDAAGAAADAYCVLGVNPTAGGGEVKKRYMRLSLLIHPDKCSHPLAHEAFQAVAAAAKMLQDSGLRSALDERRADAELRRQAEAAAAQQERERAWRVARGEEAPMAGPVGPSGPQRETWMTELPPEMSARAGGGASGGVSQTSVRAFSQRGKTSRGDTSAWTDTPEQRKAREAQALLAAASQAYVQALPAAGGPLAVGGGSSGAAAASAVALDTFNAGTRKKSLMEVHLELQEKAREEARAAKKAAKKQKTGDGEAKGGAGGGGSGETAGGTDWPWRPFDRDRDLELKPKAKSGSDILKSAAALGMKFAGGGTQRHFL